MEETMDIKCMARYFWNRKVVILCILLSCFLLLNAYLLFFTQNLYSNTVRVRIGVDATANKIASYNDLLHTTSLIEAAIKDSRVVAKVSEIKDNLSITANIGSRIYTITLNYKDKVDGKHIMGSIINVFADKVKLYDGNSVSIYDNIVTSNNPVNYNFYKKEAIYLFISLVIAFGIMYFVYYFDYSIKSIADLKDSNVLGTITDSKDNKNISLIKTKIKLNDLGNLILMNTAREIDCEEELEAILKDFSKDSKVLLIDTNMRNKKSKKQGYSDLLVKNNNNYSKLIQTKDGISTMTSGTVHTNLESLLSSENNYKLLNELKKKYDYVVLYNHNGVDYSDSLILSKMCDATYVLVELNATDIRDYEKLINNYKQINVDINGVIVIDHE